MLGALICGLEYTKLLLKIQEAKGNIFWRHYLFEKVASGNFPFSKFRNLKKMGIWNFENLKLRKIDFEFLKF